MPPHGDYLVIATHHGCLTCCYLEKKFREIKERANVKIARVELESIFQCKNPIYFTNSHKMMFGRTNLFS